MGDRVLMQCAVKVGTPEEEVGPVIYCHWAGPEAPTFIRELAKRMKDRPGDLHYASARLAQIAMDGDDGDLGFGIWNQPTRLTSEDSHGDAGCVVIRVDEGFKCDCRGGYLSTDPIDGFPVADY